MTRKDYLTLSAALNDGRRVLELHGTNPAQLIGYDNAAHALASRLAKAKANPCFDPQRFVADAGAQS